MGKPAKPVRMISLIEDDMELAAKMSRKTNQNTHVVAEWVTFRHFGSGSPYQN